MPKTVKKLSKDAEDKLLDGLEQVAVLVNNGEHPDDAICKIASAMALPVGHVKLMVHGYNNGRTLGQVRSGDSLAEKTADFALADLSTILERMYPATAKTANDRHNAAAVSDDYSMPTDYWQARRTREAKRAAALKFNMPPMTDKKASDPAYTAKAITRKLASVTRCQQNVEDAERGKIAAGYTTLHVLTKLATYFRQPGCIPFAEVRDNAVLTKGNCAAAIFKHLDNKAFQKQSSVAPTPVNWNAEPYTLVTACIKAAQSYKQYKEAAVHAREEATVKTAETYAPFCQARGPRVITGSVWADQSPTKEAGTFGGMVAGGAITQGTRGIVDKFGPKPTEALVQKGVNDLASPEHEAKLQSIRTQAMLHDLMLNDPVISGHNPDSVVDAYNQISHMAPRVAHHRMLMQALLRKYLEQASTMDMYDQSQMLNVERELARMSSMSSPQSSFAGGTP